ncbi:MAG: cupin domain-containing protein [Acidaminococcaceae bacterium]|nr:cupin domain-containing protein [Acidaminococcaceae bacterium]
MHIILLSGGSGKRLWPLSNDIRSKQFIKIFKKTETAVTRNSATVRQNAENLPEKSLENVYIDDAYESMVQRVYRQIKTADSDATVTIATSKSQVSAIHNQLGNDVGISVEPCRRDTFPAIALATAYLHDVKGVPADEAVVVCPVDPYVNEDYFMALKQLWELAQQGTANLVLMGIQPTYPSEKYGYIMPVTSDRVSKVSTFKEKPDAATAQQYIEQGGLWNGGVFAYKISYVLERAHQLLDFSDYADLFSKYESATKISFDYAVAEHEPDIAVMRFNGEWKDLGTWNTLTEAMEENIVGDGRLNETCRNVHVINELGIPVLAMGLRDVVISASSEGILVSDKEQSSYIKPFVDAIDSQVMFAEKSWGQYRVLDVEENSMTIKVTLNPGHKMNYHSHEKRDEVWTVISGTGHTIVDGMEQPVKAGDVITMAAGCKHTVIADTKLQLIEVQLGNDISVNDKHKYEME